MEQDETYVYTFHVQKRWDGEYVAWATDESKRAISDSPVNAIMELLNACKYFERFADTLKPAKHAADSISG